jgi:hypothetical protein
MASGCFPVNFDYTLLEVESYYPDSISDNDLSQRNSAEKNSKLRLGATRGQVQYYLVLACEGVQHTSLKGLFRMMS